MYRMCESPSHHQPYAHRRPNNHLILASGHKCINIGTWYSCTRETCIKYSVLCKLLCSDSTYAVQSGWMRVIISWQIFVAVHSMPSSSIQSVVVRLTFIIIVVVENDDEIHFFLHSHEIIPTILIFCTYILHVTNSLLLLARCTFGAFLFTHVGAPFDQKLINCNRK